ncbi:PDR/VanB family oxidoreductase [Pseudaminobacter salicylatoxidans]|uniref:PDR/VanB family oxidoreductase n=1 Tax=Pseudaminobacter salicylatoxidans TaxID=93369 RepID=UPI001FCC54AB|nr:PDR/VanB family oxidoreductase [Pseudaminobacter salicylatoxidans]
MNDITMRDSMDLMEAGAVFDVDVAAVKTEADGVVSLELKSSYGQSLPGWTPGAHIDVILPNALVRQYSLCGDPQNPETWRIGVLREPASRGGSSCIHEDVRVGDRLQVTTPRNNFALVDAERYLFIAGGIGITPILPMIRQAADGGKPWTLLYGGRTRNSMAFLDEISTCRGGEVHIMPQDEFGLLDLPRFLGAPRTDTAVYCCGPGPLIDAVEENCRTWRAGALHRERFAPSVKPQLETGAFEVELARSGQRLTVPPHTSLLSVLENAGHKITNSCRAGICGTCLVKVLAGTPQHNDDVLSDADRESGAVMLVCVSRSESELLVLDL